jgi:hypothetical protein
MAADVLREVLARAHSEVDSARARLEVGDHGGAIAYALTAAAAAVHGLVAHLRDNENPTPALGEGLAVTSTHLVAARQATEPGAVQAHALTAIAAGTVAMGQHLAETA